ncbi:VOC family protein [Pseudooceanicola sp. LIPI14-2-Ac024]|uniref:VOC family protein n=1 Tax=Pseudooceanicola sp. LIPI14-2-Ac024 TaxID=3344875 RepID=UPI0035D02ECC
MGIYLRQICLVARNLSPTIDTLRDVFGLAPVFVDEAVGQYGLENTLMGVGTQFLEVVAPVREDTAAGRYLDRMGGDSGYMVICQAQRPEEQAAVRANAAAHGVRVANERDAGSYRMMQLHPGDMGAAFLSVPWVEGGDTRGTWPFAGGTGWQDLVTDDFVTAITAAELRSSDPDKLAAHWGAVSGLRVETRGGLPMIKLGNATLRFAETRNGRPDRLAGLDLAVRGRDRILSRARKRGLSIFKEEVEICGVRFALNEAD